MTTEEQPQQRSERWRLLLGVLAEQGSLGVAEAASRLGVSTATVRRDFTALQEQQLATRTHGGVVATSVAYDLPARYRSTDGQTAKERIAQTAAALVTPGMVVGCNGGTTTSATARHLASRADLTRPGQDGVTIVTNALNIASEMVLRPHLRTVCIGGVARRESYELFGPFASRFLAELRLDLLFLGVNAISVEDGAMCRHLGEAGINSEMVAHSDQVAVVATSDKLTRTALARIAPIGSIDVLITDSAAEPAAVESLEAAGVTVHLA
ncbi:MAG: DeoR/GlpR family DNA-binding transcription regulator [Actinomycetota bacterium]|nr:DeoR/GlpR family DNA-binding transcription regulator [Actinomycetota bacterium]